MVAQISKNKKLKKKKSENYIFFQETFTKKRIFLSFTLSAVKLFNQRMFYKKNN